MLLEIIIALLLGVLFCVLVWQHSSKPTKSLIVTNQKRTQTVLLKYTSFESFSEKCRAKFDLGKNEKLQFSSWEHENIALDEECIEDLEDKSLLIVKGETDASVPNDDVDYEDDDDFINFEIVGSNTAQRDTVVDNADVKKWEDLQQGGLIKEHISKYGLKNITSVLKENVTAWKNKPLNIAVTGESGKGKSSFINAFRGLYPGQEGAAEVDEEECTKKCRAFRHPKYNSFVLWDVPGVGTITFPKEDYLDDIQIERFDFFIIISSTRFSELESWLAKAIFERKKRLYFIRTKIDIDMSNKKKRYMNREQVFCEKDEFDKMKTDISQKLYSELKVERLPLFMISNNHPDKYDFPSILNRLLEDVPAEKKDAMVFGLAGISKDILEEKASALKSRIWKVALLSGVGAAVPLPFFSAGIDTALILEEVLFYREQFGLDDQSLTHLSDMAGTSLEHLKCSVEFQTPAKLFTSAGLAKYLMKYATREAAETVVKYTIPVVGVAISCGMSYSTTMSILEGLLDIMKQDALKVLVYVTTKRTETEID